MIMMNVLHEGKGLGWLIQAGQHSLRYLYFFCIVQAFLRRRFTMLHIENAKFARKMSIMFDLLQGG